MDRHLDGAVLSWTFDQPHITSGTFAADAYRGHALRAAGEVVWIDPPDPGPDEPALLELGRPAHVLVTYRHHERAVDMLAERYGARVWLPRGKGGQYRRVDEEYGEDTKLPAGLRAIAMPGVGFGEHALTGTLHGQRFAFVGDSVLNLDYDHLPTWIRFLIVKRKSGQLQRKTFYLGGRARDAVRQAQRLLELDLDALFVAHGADLPTGAAAALKESLPSWL